MKKSFLIVGALVLAIVLFGQFGSSEQVSSDHIKFPNVLSIMNDVLPDDAPQKELAEIVEIVKNDRGQYDFRGARSLNPHDPVHQLFLQDDPKYLEFYRELLLSGNRFLQAAALDYWGRMEDHESVDTIIGFLNVHDNLRIQRMAAIALGKLNATQAIPQLLKLQYRLIKE